MNKIKSIIFIIFIVSLLITIIELYLNYTKPTPYTHDVELGWTAKKNFEHTYKEKDFYGVKYDSIYSTNRLGARFFSMKVSKKKNNQIMKIMVIGDSFTMDPYVGNNDMWFSIVASDLSKKINQTTEVLAFGAGAYGNFQQYLLLNRQITKDYSFRNYKPDFLIMQFCSNDFSNNNLELEKSSFALSQYMRRPYLVSNKIYYHKSFLSPLFRKLFFFKDSRIFSKLVFIYEFIVKKYFHSDLQIVDSKVISQAKKTTLKILTNIRNLYPNTPSFIFSCSNMPSKLNNNWKEIAKLANYIVLDKSSNFIDEGRRGGKKIFYKDGGHLNKQGNFDLGKLILEEISENIKLIN